MIFIRTLQQAACELWVNLAKRTSGPMAKEIVWSECYDKPCRARVMKVGAKSGPGHYEVFQPPSDF